MNSFYCCYCKSIESNQGNLSSRLPNVEKNYENFNNNKIFTFSDRFNNKNSNNKSDKNNVNKFDNRENDSKDGGGGDMVIVNVSQFVAKIKGGFKQAKRIADKLNIKLVNQVNV